MKKLLKNKQVILAVLVMVIVVAGAVNWAVRRADDQSIPVNSNQVTYDETDAQQTNGVPEATQAPDNDYFANARLDRDTSRSKELDIQKEIINNDKTTIDAKKDAEQEVKRIALAIENEGVIESLVKAKGFSQVVTFIGKDSINVIVSGNGILPAQVAQIKDIVIEKTGTTADKIKIVEAK